MIAAVPLPVLSLPGIAAQLDETPGSMRWPPPRFGKHAKAVLTDLE